MDTAKDYKNINKTSWNKRTEVHIDSQFYANDSFVQGRNSLNEIELYLLGEIEGKKILHLQCHFGQDTISLTRLGAQAVGVDLSDKAIEKAKELALKTNSEATFVCCDIYDLPKNLDGKFDVVFTSYGTIGWLPDMDKWAKVIDHFLKPQGIFLIVEFHPYVWMWDNDFEKITYNYFNSEPIIETEDGTYADKNAALSQESVTWNHSLSEVMTSLLQNNLQIESFDEFDYSPYNCFNKTIEIATNKFQIEHFNNKIPMIYAIKAIKK